MTIETAKPRLASARLWGRAYFAVQALAGAAWWVAVFTVPVVREATLGSLNAPLVALLDIPLFVVASAVAATGWRPAAIIATAWTALVAVALAAYATLTGEAGWGVIIMLAASGASIIALSLMMLGRVPTELLTRGPFAFRQAADTAPVSRHVLGTFGQLVVFWGLFLLVFPLIIAALESRWGFAIEFAPAVRVAGIAVLVGASALGVWSAITMSTVGRGTPLPGAMPNALVIAGPYRFVRNPMAVAGIAQGIAVGLMLSSWFVVAYAVIGSFIWNYAVRPLEEADLESRFGDEFRRYRNAVRCWMPRLPAAR